MKNNKQIIVLDEATVSLDLENQEVILSSISSLKDKIIVIVSHSKDVIEKCDLIYELKNGKLLNIKK